MRREGVLLITGAESLEFPWGEVEAIDSTHLTALDGRQFRFTFYTSADREAFLSYLPGAADSDVNQVMIVTTETLPGYTVIQTLGVVSNLSANSGWTAAAKGNNALWDALVGLKSAAVSLGANAVIGLSGSTFGARGGVTSGLGGDAVGILLLGTAVVVAPTTSAQSVAPSADGLT